MIDILYISNKMVSIVTGKSSEGCDTHKIYQNNPTGRSTIASEQPTKIVDKVMLVWGDTPTVPDYIPVPPQAPTTAQQIANLKQQLTATDYQIIKCSECQLAGQPMPYDVAALHAHRQALRYQINEFEATL